MHVIKRTVVTKSEVKYIFILQKSIAKNCSESSYIASLGTISENELMSHNCKVQFLNDASKRLVKVCSQYHWDSQVFNTLYENLRNRLFS